MRISRATLFLCLLFLSVTPASAQPLSDRYLHLAWGGYAQDVLKAKRKLEKSKPTKRNGKRRPRQESPSRVSPSLAVIRKPRVSVPLPRPRPEDVELEKLIFACEVFAAPPPVLPIPLPAPDAPVRGNLFVGFAREISRALPRSRSEDRLVGVVPALAAMTRKLVSLCGATVISGVRRTYVRGSGRRSLHWDGRAVDIVGNPDCMYAQLRNDKYAGGYSTDYYRIRPNHLHLSWGGREHGRRFAHWQPGKKHYAKRGKRVRLAAR